MVPTPLARGGCTRGWTSEGRAYCPFYHPKTSFAARVVQGFGLPYPSINAYPLIWGTKQENIIELRRTLYSRRSSWIRRSAPILCWRALSERAALRGILWGSWQSNDNTR
jgi:hypothetical protein